MLDSFAYLVSRFLQELTQRLEDAAAPALAPEEAVEETEAECEACDIAAAEDRSGERSAALRTVLNIYSKSDVDMPAVFELIVLAEWVMDGSVSAAAAFEGQQAELAARHFTVKDTDDE